MRRNPASGSGVSRVLAIGCGLALCGCLFCCGGGALYMWRSGEAAKREMADANRLWDAGRKEDAVKKYKAVLDRNLSHVPSDAERPVVYQRVIDTDLERGADGAARARIAQALDQGVDLSPCSPAALQLIAQVRADRERRAAEEQARREEQRKNAPHMSVKLVKVRTAPFRAATGLDTIKVYVDWKNTGNRPVRWLAVKLRGYDSRDVEVEGVMPVKEYGVYWAVPSDGPGVAPGETYVTPDDRGLAIPPLLSKRVARVTVEVITIQEKVPE